MFPGNGKVFTGRHGREEELGFNERDQLLLKCFHMGITPPGLFASPLPELLNKGSFGKQKQQYATSTWISPQF